MRPAVDTLCDCPRAAAISASLDGNKAGDDVDCVGASRQRGHPTSRGGHGLCFAVRHRAREFAASDISAAIRSRQHHVTKPYLFDGVTLVRSQGDHEVQVLPLVPGGLCIDDGAADLVASVHHALRRHRTADHQLAVFEAGVVRVAGLALLLRAVGAAGSDDCGGCDDLLDEQRENEIRSYRISDGDGDGFSHGSPPTRARHR